MHRLIRLAGAQRLNNIYVEEQREKAKGWAIDLGITINLKNSFAHYYYYTAV